MGTTTVDLLDLTGCIDRNISLVTKDNVEHEGTLYTVDPVSESIVILIKKENRVGMDLIFKHAVKEVVSVGELNPINIYLGKEKSNLGNLSLIRQKLKNWLTKNLIPVEESGECLKLPGQLTINPPYGKENCISSNEVVLSKIQMLIERMPCNE